MNWLLIRGLGRDKEHWYNFPNKIEAQIPNSKVFSINLPGLEGEKNPPMNIHEISDFIRKKWLKLKEENSGPWSVLAISLGGMIAIDWCNKHTKDFEKIVIVNSSSKSTSSTFERMSPLAMKTILKSFLISDPIKREKLVLNLILNKRDIDENLLGHMVSVSKKMKLNKIIFFKQLFAASKFKLPAEIKTPLTVLTTKGDRFTSYKCSEEIAKKFNAPIFIHPDAGHDLPMDDPDWIISKL